MALRCVALFASSSEISTAPPMRGEAEKSSSTELMALRTSPPQLWAMCSATPSSSRTAKPSRSESMPTARVTAGSTSSAGTVLNSKTVLRLSRAL